MTSLKLLVQWQYFENQKNAMPQKECILPFQITLNIKMFSEKLKQKLWALTGPGQHKPAVLPDP